MAVKGWRNLLSELEKPLLWAALGVVVGVVIASELGENLRSRLRRAAIP